MVQLDIQAKLRRLLAGNSISTEAEVVYLLAECRKLLERDPSLKGSSPTLVFYLNWCLHTELSHAGAKKFLMSVNSILTLAPMHTQAEHEVLDSLLTLDAFRVELRSLLASFGADLSICDDTSKWTSFLHLYSQVVQDSQLVLEATPPPSGLMQLAVKRVTVSAVAGDPLVDPGVGVYPMIWMIEYEDGRAGRLELSRFGLAGAVVYLFGTTLEAVSAIHQMHSQNQSN